MNGLSLRINGGGTKIKNPLGFEPISISSEVINIKSLRQDDNINGFLEGQTIDVQLAFLKNILTSQDIHGYHIHFLVVVFLQAEAKHPIKSFLTRSITRNVDIQQEFSKTLASEISTMIQNHPSEYNYYKDTVPKLATCIENFPPGVAAFRSIENTLFFYLSDCMSCSVNTLSETTLSPTEKTEVFNLIHLTLRLLLNIVQKVSNKENITAKFSKIRNVVKDVLFDEDAPMDTKSVCGMLLVVMHLTENGDDSWIELLSNQKISTNLVEMLTNDSAKLSLYSAIATVVPTHKLHSITVDDEIAVIVLIDQVLEIGERTCSDSTFTLGVTRCLVYISKSLEKSQNIGVTIINRLLVYMWSHLEHYMDSVRHLTAQMLNNIVKYSAKMKRDGDESGLNDILKALNSLDKHRKSYYLTLTSLANELGASYLTQVIPDVINSVICVLHVQAVQASATTFLEVLIQKFMKESSSDVTYQTWVEPILTHVTDNTLDSAVMNILENLLALAVKTDKGIMDYIVPYINDACAVITRTRLKCVLLLSSVVRHDIPRHVLEMAAVDCVDETRILALSLVVESTKTTEMFTQKDLDFVLYFLKYNCNAQAPHFRQLVLSIIKKFIKRLDDSCKVLKRNGSDTTYYLEFINTLREQCYSGLLRGSNYSRRVVSLQILDWLEHLSLDGYERTWKFEYVDRLLVHLEDSYENNKILALNILKLCPEDMFQEMKFSISLKLEDILNEASSVKPTDCTNAAYKLLLLKYRCPSQILDLDTSRKSPEQISYTLAQRVLSRAEDEVRICENSVARAAKDSPVYGLLHCLRYILEDVNASAISLDNDWCSLIARTIACCMRASAAVACVVNNDSPEGHLPMDMGTVQRDSNICLQDGRPVTAQMVLLCAWRSVKEASLLLGTITSRLSIEGEGEGFSISRSSVRKIGAHYTTLLAETKHRGAFEQAYVGFTKLLARLWRCRSPELHELPKQWLEDLLQLIENGDSEKLCATRRSAGLPYMIQALVITELQVTGNPKCFAQCMRTLVRVATHSASVEARTHCTNILRALYRNSSLDDVVAPYVGDGLLLALNGFDGNTWQERNASTLLFSALMVRVFGVRRAGDVRARDRMTGRIFFLRYPPLADYMLDKLSKANDSEASLRPSVYPVLLILARLYPSALEGTVSNLKLTSFIPGVLSCARSPVLKTRQLAATAILPLISPHMYISHMQTMLQLIADPHIKKNYCHGIILQLIKLLKAKPDNLNIEESSLNVLSETLFATKWIVAQTLTNIPCYLLTDDYVKMIDLFVQTFPEKTYSKLITEIRPLLLEILFSNPKSIINSGKDICLANIVILYLTILDKSKNIEDTCVFIQKCLKHQTYEVILVILNNLLSVQIISEDRKLLIVEDSLKLLRKQNYIQLLCDILNNKYLECTQKALHLLVLEKNTQKEIIQAKLGLKENIIESLIYLLETEHENLTYIYLKSLTNYLSDYLVKSEIDGKSILEAIRVIFRCAFSNNADDTREVVVEFLEESLEILLSVDIDLEESELFELKATIWSTIAILLEDDEQDFRQRISCIITTLYNKKTSQNTQDHVIPSKAVEFLMELIISRECGKEVLCVLALLDFKSEVCMNDEVNDECRVFDTNERYNIFSEEAIFTSICARALQMEYNEINIAQYVDGIINNPKFINTFRILCDQNLMAYTKKNVENAKVELFISLVSGRIF